MSKAGTYLCGVPFEHCMAPMKDCSASLRDRHYRTGALKAHSSRDESFRCCVHYLTKVLGYKRVGGREFSPPDGGPIRVLTKKIRFGGRLRGGKQERAMPSGIHTGGMVFSA